MADKYDTNLQAELSLEDKEFEKYLTETPPADSKINTVDKPQQKPEHKTVNNQKVWSRNSKYAKDTIAIANYSCEINKDHKHFIFKVY